MGGAVITARESDARRKAPKSPPRGASAARPTGPVVLAAQGLVKRHGKRVVLGGLDLLLRRGELVAVLGQRGAGRTTLAAILAGQSLPDTGRIRRGGRVAPLVGHSAGFGTTGRLARDLGLRAAAAGLDGPRFARAVAETVGDPFILDLPFDRIDPSLRAPLLSAAAWLVPAAIYIADGGLLPTGPARLRLAPALERARREAGVLWFTAGASQLRAIGPDRILALENGLLRPIDTLQDAIAYFDEEPSPAGRRHGSATPKKLAQQAVQDGAKKPAGEQKAAKGSSALPDGAADQPGPEPATAEKADGAETRAARPSKAGQETAPPDPPELERTKTATPAASRATVATATAPTRGTHIQAPERAVEITALPPAFGRLFPATRAPSPARAPVPPPPPAPLPLPKPRRGAMTTTPIPGGSEADGGTSTGERAAPPAGNRPASAAAHPGADVSRIAAQPAATPSPAPRTEAGGQVRVDPKRETPPQKAAGTATGVMGVPAKSRKGREDALGAARRALAIHETVLAERAGPAPASTPKTPTVRVPNAAKPRAGAGAQRDGIVPAPKAEREAATPSRVGALGTRLLKAFGVKPGEPAP